MIITVFIWSLIFFETGTIGNAIQKLFFPKTTYRDISLIQILIGLVAITTLGSYFSLFFKIGSVFSISLFLLSVVLYIKNQPNLINLTKLSQFSPLHLLLFASAFLLILELSTHRVLNPDTNIYHAQAIRWIESYPAIKGLGNLYGRLAFNSSWFITNAIFSFSFLGGQSFHLVSGFLYLVITLSQLSKLSLPIPTSNAVNFIRFIIIAFGFFYLGSDLSSPGSDTPTTLIIWLIALYLLQYIENQKPDHLVFLCIMSIFAITIKLSSFMLLALIASILIQFFAKKEYHRIGLIIGFSFFILFPFLLRNIILSGYLIYPFPALDLFDVNWKVPIERVIEERNAIFSWGRLPGDLVKEVMNLSLWEWLPIWFERLTFIRRLLVLMAATSFLPVLLLRYSQRISKLYALNYFIFFAGFTFWIMVSPDFRFGYSFLIPTIALAYIPLLIFTLSNISVLPPINKILIPLVGFIILYTAIFSFDQDSISNRLLEPVAYDTVKTVPCKIGNADLFCAKNFNECSYYAFPCIPHDRLWVNLAGKDYSEGFFGVK